MKDLEADLHVALPAHLRLRFNQSLEGSPIDGVTVDKIDSGEIPPRGICG